MRPSVQDQEKTSLPVFGISVGTLKNVGYPSELMDVIDKLIIVIYYEAAV